MNIRPTAVSFNIQGRNIAGECYGDMDGIPVIALHGWLDNCRSFSRLAPLLEGVCLLAVDLAGHGHSDHRSNDASYHIWDDLREILLVADHMGWQQFVLVGHSRGAIIANMLAAVAPERILQLVLIEGFWPQTMNEADAPQQLARFLKHFLDRQTIEKSYTGTAEMIEVRCRSGYGMARDVAAELVGRNAVMRNERYYWRTDSRLLMPSPLMLTESEAHAFIKAVVCPVLLIMGESGMGKSIDLLRPRFAAFTRFGVMILEGGHHLHMESAAEKVAVAVNQFLKA